MKKIWVLIKNALAWLWSYIKKGLEWIFGYIKKAYDWVLSRNQIYFCIIILAILTTAFSGDVLHIEWPIVLPLAIGLTIELFRYFAKDIFRWRYFVCWVIGALLMDVIYLIS